MNEKEVLQDLLKTPKPYTYIKMHQSKFSNTITRYRAGILKPATLRGFLENFGYFRENEVFVKRFDFTEKRRKANGK